MESNDVKRRFSSAPTSSNAVSSGFILSTVTQFDSPSKTSSPQGCECYLPGSSSFEFISTFFCNTFNFLSNPGQSQITAPTLLLLSLLITFPCAIFLISSLQAFLRMDSLSYCTILPLSSKV